MPGPAPKPNAHRRQGHAETFQWVQLPPEGRQGPPPPIPEWHDWSEAARDEWTRWWSTPWATQWHADDPALGRLLYIFDQIITGHGNAALMAEARQIEDRLGFSPKSRLQLRWLIATGDPARASQTYGAMPTARARRKTLKVV